jgi:hypothetical protein
MHVSGLVGSVEVTLIARIAMSEEMTELIGSLKDTIRKQASEMDALQAQLVQMNKEREEEASAFISLLDTYIDLILTARIPRGANFESNGKGE